MAEFRTPPPITPGFIGQFFLEIAGLIGAGRLGWHLGAGGLMGLALALLFVAVAGGIWGVFRTPGYVPSGGHPVVPTPGPIRLVIELGYFLIAAWGLWISGWQIAAIIMIIAVIVVYWALRDRTLGLLRNQTPTPRPVAPHRRTR